MDSIINNLPIVDLTDKYGGLAAQLNGKSEAYNRSWTDNRNSRMKHDLYRYAQAYFDADYATLATYAERHRQRAERLRHKRLAV